MRLSFPSSVSTIALGAALAAVSGFGAEAACVITGGGSANQPGVGSTVNCTGIDPGPIRTLNSDVTVNVLENATLGPTLSNDAAISLGDRSRVTVANGANLVGSGKGALDNGNSLTLLLQNGGTIRDTVLADSNSNLTIGGAIRTVELPVAIGLRGTGNRVTLTPGYSIEGIVYGANYDDSGLPFGGPLPAIPAVSPIDPTSVLALGGTGNGTFDVSTVGQDAQYRNFGALEKTGTSTFVLTGTSTAALPFAINGGTAQVEGDMQTFVTTVNNGGALSGTGTAGQTNVAAGGVLSPGNAANPTGMLTIFGPLGFAAGSFYNVNITPTDSSYTLVTGATTIAGGTVNVAAGAGTYAPNTSYEILFSKGGVAGRFAAVATNLAFLAPTLSYDSNSVYLTLLPSAPTPSGTPNYRTAAITQNQTNVAGGLTQAGKAMPGGNGGRILTALNQLTAPQARAAFDALSGEGITAAQNVANRSAQLFTSSIFDQTTFYGAGPTANSLTLFDPSPIRELADLPSAKFQPTMPVAPNRTWRAWATGFGGVDNIHGDGAVGSSYQQNTIYGGTLGVDYQLTPNYLVGVAVGGTNGDFRVAGRGTSGSSTGGHVAIYDLATFGAFYGASSSAFSYFGNRTNRFVAGFGGLGNESERGNFNSNELRTRLEFGRHFAGYGGVLTPFVALELAQLRSNGFTENTVQGAGLFRLNVSGQSQASAPAFVGVRLQRATSIGNGIVLSPTLQVAYVHEFAPYRSQTGTIADLPGATFLVDGARPARNAAQVKAGAEMTIGPRSVIFANFDGELSSVNQLYAGKGGFRYAW